MRYLAAAGILLHGLGVKEEGLRALARWLVSADSLAWSSRGVFIGRNLATHYGTDGIDPEAIYRAILAGAVLPALRVQADLWLRFGAEQQLANSQAYGEHWRDRQLEIIAAAANVSAPRPVPAPRRFGLLPRGEPQPGEPPLGA